MRLLALLLALASIGCDQELSIPLEVLTRVEPATIAQGDSVTIRVVLRNPSSQLIEFDTPDGCLAGFQVLASTGDQVAANENGCYLLVTPRRIPPRDSLVAEFIWDSREWIDPGYRPVTAGTYRVVGQANVRPPVAPISYEGSLTIVEAP